MKRITLSDQYCKDFYPRETYKENIKKVKQASNLLSSRQGPGNEFLGWMHLPSSMTQDQLSGIQDVADKIRNDSEVLIVIGIGGSYLGARAGIEALYGPAYNYKIKTEIYFAGINISGQYLEDLLLQIGDKDFSLNVISKSGTTTEPAISFRILKQKLEQKYGVKRAKKRIYATTDARKGALKKLADEEGYTCFIIPDDVGGRFSVLTPVGLLPLAVAGVDLRKLLEGAKAAQEDATAPSDENIIHQYATIRNVLYQGGKQVEILVNYEPRLHQLAEWWKQLYGESEGKEGKGIFPASVDFTSDLHSMGQYIQDGKRNLFETVLHLENSNSNLTIPHNDEDLDGLNYLAGKTLAFVNQKAMEGTIMAHVSGGVPNIVIQVPELNAFYLGYLFYFFERACAISGYVLGVNPFDQPGVEAYKSNMFKLLGKPGF